MLAFDSHNRLNKDHWKSYRSTHFGRTKSYYVR